MPPTSLVGASRRTGARRCLAALAAIGLAAVALPRFVAPPAAVDCPPGYQRASDRPEEVVPGPEAAPEFAGGPAEVELEGTEAIAVCVSVRRPESFGELAAANGQLASRQTAPFRSLRPGAYAAAVEAAAALRAPGTVPGDGGAWVPLGVGPLKVDDPVYNEVNKAGHADVEGRIQDFAVVPATDTVYVSVANGGVWKSTDLGRTWTSVGDTLPTQIVASVARAPIGGGRLLVMTGDSAFGGNSFTGIGAYWSDDDGATWNKATGVPDGVIGHRIAVDPTNSQVVYAATGGGLFRSTDGGRSYANTRLPTSPACTGVVNAHPCFLANQVTDVVVQAPDTFGNTGGAVVAAVGWRAGTKANEDGTVQAPGNGIYRSPSGEPGTFVKLTGGASVPGTERDPTGFAEQARVGRVELGLAEGPAQNHDYLYAVVQDAVLFNGGVPTIDAPETIRNPNPFGNSTVLSGIYVSPDLGSSWTLLADEEELRNDPTNRSALAPGVGTVIFSPGVQSWYNAWIEVDPTRALSGAPTRVTFGLEEIWQNRLTSVPVTTPAAQFEVFGRYWNYCQFLITGAPACAPQGPTLGTTTHPDQHGAAFVPRSGGGVTLLAGNDGGVYRQDAPANDELDNDSWGRGDNAGFNTLLPYQAVMSADGTTYAGLQDNGTIKIEPGTGRQLGIFGGDGFYVATEPDNSEVSYSEVTAGNMRVSVDGGRTFTDIPPPITNAKFSNPFKMDPTDDLHLITAGREVVERLEGPGGDWVEVFDLGTRNRDGDAGARANNAADDPANSMSALDVQGANAYVAYCGFCDVLTQQPPFDNGLATNVGGSAPPRKGMPDGWHIAAAAGLPKRYVTDLAVDPLNPRIVYATVAGYGRRWAPPGAVGEDISGVGTGHVFKSTDAGETFTDISGNLPDVPANWIEVRGGQLVVATDVGVLASSNTVGTEWAMLGDDLPTVPVFSLQLAPQDPDLLVAATFGRGVYTYRFNAPAPPRTDPVEAPAAVIPEASAPVLLPLLGLAAGIGVLGWRRRRSAVAP